LPNDCGIYSQPGVLVAGVKHCVIAIINLQTNISKGKGDWIFILKLKLKLNFSYLKDIKVGHS